MSDIREVIDEWGKGAKYWDQAWNPMIGCRKISEGCANCYAARLAARYPELQSADGSFEPHPPKHLKRPPSKGVVFVGNMTDIFGEWNDLDKVCDYWLTMLSKHATNLILTKRPERMDKIVYLPHGSHLMYGVTAENQTRLYERLRRCGFRIMDKIWLSLEPLLGEVNMGRALETASRQSNIFSCMTPEQMMEQYLSWVVIGAESGPNRRPCKLEGVRWAVLQCRKAGVPVFVKQLDIGGKLVKDISKFPEDLQIRQVPWKKVQNEAEKI